MILIKLSVNIDRNRSLGNDSLLSMREDDRLRLVIFRCDYYLYSDVACPRLVDIITLAETFIGR